MADPNHKINPGHDSIRWVLRLIGPALLLVGVIFMIVGFVDLVGVMGGHREPTKFWCFFVGMPLLFFGFVITNMAFMGALLRYHAQETAPVAVDTINYMADGTQEGVKTVSRAVGAGLAEGLASNQSTSAATASPDIPASAFASSPAPTAASSAATPPSPVKVILCHKCNCESPAGSRFCNICGAPLSKTRPCPACGELNDPDARFCDNCGRAMGE